MGASKFQLRVGALWLVIGTGSAWSQNVIQLENAKPGDSDWGLTSLSDAPTVEGYASATSVNRGETIELPGGEKDERAQPRR